MREYFCAYHSMLGAMRKLSDAECGRLFRALLKYSAGDEPDNLQGREDVLFDVFSQQIDRDAERYEKKCQQNKENVSGRKRSSTTVNDRKQSKTAVNVRNQDKEKDKEKEKDEVVPPTPYKGFGGDDELLATADSLNAVFDAAEGIGLKGQAAMDIANGLAADYSPEWVLEAIKRTSYAASSAWNWRYIKKILDSWKASGGIDDGKPKPKQSTTGLNPWLERGDDG